MNFIEIVGRNKIEELQFIDPRTSQGLQEVLNVSNTLLSKTNNIEELRTLETEIIGCKYKLPIIVDIAVKAAISKKYISTLTSALHLEIIVPMFHESTRLAPRISSDASSLVNTLEPDENGEDELLRKYQEMEWLTKNTQLTYHIRVVDDMCDQNSGTIAESLIDANNLQEKISVHFLKDYLNFKREDNPFVFESVKKVIDKKDSVRGGSLCLGFALAIETNRKNKTETVLSYIDADTSYSLTSIGIPISMLKESENLKIVTANRQHPMTRLDKKKSNTITSSRSNGLIRLKQTIGYIRKQVLSKYVPGDTQSGFKVVRTDVMEKLLWQPNKANNFSYDTQLLSRIANMFKYKSIDTFGVVLVDSDELTTANNDRTYYNAVKILNTINSESPKAINSNVRYLLNVISTYENYLELLNFLDDKNPELFFPNDKSLQSMLLDIRTSILTEVDSTAVGKYYTQELLNNLVLLFNYYMLGINSIDLELIHAESEAL